MLTEFYKLFEVVFNYLSQKTEESMTFKKKKEKALKSTTKHKQGVRWKPDL